MTVKIATWNVQRPSKGGALNPQRLQKMQKCDADIWILTETREVISLQDWHNLTSFPIPSYHAEGETLVTIWSKWPIRAVSASRFTACAEIIIPSLGPSLIYGTVIPWDKDEGFSERFKAGRWEEHRRQTKVQTSEWEVLAKSYPKHLLFILGDFNQHRGQIGSYKDIESVSKISDSLLSCGLECITQNNDKCANLSKPLVDHICLPKNLVPYSSLDVWPYDEIEKVRLSDHHGVMVTITSPTSDHS
jgi:hypothetical protein